MSSRTPKGGGKGRGRGRKSASAPVVPPPAPALDPSPTLPSAPTEPAAAPVSPTLASSALQSAVQEVVAHAERRAIERTLPPAVPVTPRPPAVWLAAAGLSWVTVFLTLLRPPAWLEGPQPAPYAPPAAVSEASDRYALWLAAGRIERFVARQGRLPSFLGETGFDDARLRYTVTGEWSWTIDVADAGAGVRLASTDDRDAVLGDALDQLQQRR